MEIVKGGPQILWEGQADLSRPFWARFDQFHGYTGYRILDTGYRYTGTPPPPHPPPRARRAKLNMGSKPVKSDLFQKWPRTLWEYETDLKRIQ